jgi:uncharacterized repeat protein (TIGR03803 family)
MFFMEETDMRSKQIFSTFVVLAVAAVTLSLAVRVQAQTESIIFTFTGYTTTGQNPSSGLVADASGNLYGVTPYGGKQGRYCPNSMGCGYAYELSPNGSGEYTETILYNFLEGPDGGYPVGNLIFDAAGNLYGVTGLGGYRNKVCNAGSGCGVVYELSPGSSGWTETTLYTFMNAGDGNEPYGPLTFDTAGNLYGATQFGGSTACEAATTNPCGLVFELTPSTSGSWTETTLYSFTGGNDGSNPNGGVILDSAGNVYGTASGGNPALCKVTAWCGVVYRVSKGSSGWTQTVLHTFSGDRDGGDLNNTLAFDGAGNLYGTAGTGGNSTCGLSNGCGVMFKLTPMRGAAWKETSFEFDLSDGGSPGAGITFDAQGNVYGTTVFGGDLTCNSPYGCGVVYELTPNSRGEWKSSVLHSFAAGDDGEFPASTVGFDSAGNIFGTAGGGADNDGVVYEIQP